MREYSVFAKIDDRRRIVDVNSSAFLSSADGWIEIDRGTGYRFLHAQGNYFPKPLTDDEGILRYKLSDSDKPAERTPEEMDADRKELQALSPTLESRVADIEDKTGDLEDALNLILSGVTE